MITSSQKQLRYLDAADFIEENTLLKTVMHASIVICVVSLVLLIWAGVTQIDQTARAYGQLEPKGNIYKIQDLEGGIVEEVLVEDSQRVKKGEVLLKLQPTPALAQLQQMQSRQLALLLDEARLNANIRGEIPTIDDIKQHVKNANYDLKSNELLNNMLQGQKVLLELQQQVQAEKKSQLVSIIAQKRSEVDQLQKKIKAQEGFLKIANEENEIYKKLDRDTVVSKIEVLSQQRKYQEAVSELNQSQEKLQAALRAEEEAQFKMKELILNLQETGVNEIGKVRAELLETNHAIERLQDRVHRLNVIAPVTGIVESVQVHENSIVAPNSTLLNIVPTEKKLLAKVRIDPKDIGHIGVGDQVKVRLMTFDYSSFGAIKGVLIQRSASTVTDEMMRPYYVGTIELKNDYAGDDPTKNKLLPGMTVEADIVIGRRSILGFLLKPVQASAAGAFGER